MANYRANKRAALFLLIIISLAACRTNKTPAPIVGSISDNQIKLEVAQDGMYRVSLADLQAAGLAIDNPDSASLALSQAGHPIPFTIHNDDLIFYGQAPTSRYTAVRPYILALGDGGVIMAETAVSSPSVTVSQLPQTLHLEENHRYLPQARQDAQSDVWYWQSLGQAQKIVLTIDLAAVSPQPAVLRLHLRGTTNNPAVEPDHDFDLILNGQKIDTIRWDGETLHTSETAVPANLLQTGPNELILDNEVEGASPLDIMDLNWVELDYIAPATAVNDRLQFSQTDGGVTLNGFSGPPLLFDISDPAAPQRLTAAPDDGQIQLTVAPETTITAIGPRGYLSPRIVPMRQSDWHNPDNQADLIILAADEFIPALAPLVAARQEQGLTAAAIPIAEIYDEFAYGAATPTAIQTFVAYAYQNWQEPRPRYLLLVGDATTDYRNYLGTAPPNPLPSLMVPVEFSGETVSDARLADVDGDMKPDAAVGRWPVSTVEEVASLVERTLAYERGTAVNRTLFAADNTENQFAVIANRLVDQSGLPAANNQLLTGAQADEVAAAWNKGAWLAAYIGHGSVERWGKEDIFYPEAVAGLTAAEPPIVLQLTCLTGLFAHPQLTSLSETMLLHQQGPVLIIAAASLTLSGYQEPFARNLLQALQDPANTRIGDALQQAKQSLDIENSNGLREISDTFGLLGDPSALIVRP